jgi:hypothetical protein
MLHQLISCCAVLCCAVLCCGLACCGQQLLRSVLVLQAVTHQHSCCCLRCIWCGAHSGTWHQAQVLHLAAAAAAAAAATAAATEAAAAVATAISKTLHGRSMLSAYMHIVLLQAARVHPKPPIHIAVCHTVCALNSQAMQQK